LRLRSRLCHRSFLIVSLPARRFVRIFVALVRF
jgi:hypothetical protein